MPEIRLECIHCGRVWIAQSPRRGQLGVAQIVATAIEYGWIKRGDDFICSEGCAAEHAIDVTPKAVLPAR